MRGHKVETAGRLCRYCRRPMLRKVVAKGDTFRKQATVYVCEFCDRLRLK